MKILVVDDAPEIRGQLTETLLSTGVEVQVASDVRSAIALWRPREFDVALIDLKLLQPGAVDSSVSRTYPGIQLGHKLRSTDANVLIVMYSADIDLKHEKEFAHYQECMDAGAQQVVSREWITSVAPPNLTKRLQEWKKSAIEAIAGGAFHVTIEKDILTQAVIERLGGQETLEMILLSVFPSLTSHCVKALKAGYSGAMILRVKSSGKESQVHDARNVLKINSSQLTLIEELSRGPYQGTVLDTRSVTSRAVVPVKILDWYVVSVQEVRDAQSLEKYVQERRLGAKTKTTLKRIVKELLIDPARSGFRVDTPGSNNVLPLRYCFIAEVTSALEEISKYARKFLPGTIPAVKNVQLFVKNLASGFYSLGADNSQVAKLHGDMHSQNVLIDKTGRAVLIDFGRGGLYPRLFDIASLDVDLVIRVLGSADGSQWDLRRMPSWIKILKRSFPLADEALTGDDGTSLGHLRYLVHRALVDELEAVSRREYGEVLLFQVLRFLRFATIPMPKKMLAAQWAGFIIKRLNIV